MVFRHFDESPVVYEGELVTEKIAHWFDVVSVPTVVEFSEKYSDLIFKDKRDAIVYFRAPKYKNSKDERFFRQAATQFKDDIMFVVTDI